MNPESELPEDVLAAIQENHKIDAIKLLREHRNLGLKEAKEIVDAYAAEHPHLSTGRRLNVESGLSRLVKVGILLSVLYAVYRLVS